MAIETYKPTAQNAEMAKFISKNSNVKCFIYNIAGDEYPGALEGTVNLRGISAVACDVITPHGKTARGTPSKSLSMMKSFLKFNSLI